MLGGNGLLEWTALSAIGKMAGLCLEENDKVKGTDNGKRKSRRKRRWGFR